MPPTAITSESTEPVGSTDSGGLPIASAEDYRPLFVLGRGGMADVYVASRRHSTGFQELVVLKVMKGELLHDPESYRMFLAEALLTTRLKHPNIVEVYQVLKHQSVPTLVMEYLEGQPLNKLVSRAGADLPLRLHLWVLSEMLAGLHYAHDLRDRDGRPVGIVHRDVTPHNVVISYDGRVKILDFGIAKLGGPSETRTGIVKGKLRYMAPEQIAGDKNVDRRADIFAAGLMLWEALARRRLWEGLPDAAVVSTIAAGQIPSLRKANPNCSAALEFICMKALSMAREHRHQTAVELKTAIDGAMEELGGPADASELAVFLSGKFARTRALTRRAIAKKLSEAETATMTGAFPTRTLSGPPPTVALGQNQSTTAIAVPPRARRSVPAARFSTLVLLVIATSLGFALARAHGVGRRPAAVAAPTSVAEPAPKYATLRIRALPETAALFIDDHSLASNPFMGEIPVGPDGAEKSIRAEAPGYEAETKKVSLANDLDVVFQLSKKAASVPPSAPTASATPKAKRSAPAPRARPATRPKVKRPAAPASPSTNCTTPYYINEQGIKTFKPECL